MATIGSCSLCGGPVTVPDVWMAVVPPVPTCSQCGATAAQPSGPVIPMKPRGPRYWQQGVDYISGATEIIYPSKIVPSYPFGPNDNRGGFTMTVASNRTTFLT